VLPVPEKEQLDDSVEVFDTEGVVSSETLHAGRRIIDVR
jgi:hypothetical protein